jgi:predicted MFS family arabinose efflux permease
LAVATCSGLVGAGLADYLATAYGRVRPSAAALTTIAAAGLALGHLAGGWAFALALVAYSLGFFFLVPYLMGAAAALDASGRCSVAASSTFLFGAAMGPAIGGTVLAANAGSFTALAWLMAVAVAAAGLLMTPALRALDSRTTSPRVASDAATPLAGPTLHERST